MRLDEVREELEEDLTWRLDELRQLRNSLLSNYKQEDWPPASLRTLLVMQYAHLEGFARNAFSIYVSAINDLEVPAKECHPNLLASAMIGEFDALRLGATSGGDQMDESTRLLRRANIQVAFVEKIRRVSDRPVRIDTAKAVSMEMNFGSDVLRRTLYMLGIPEELVGSHFYRSLEFVRRMRNDIAHGDKKERIEHGAFTAHSRKCEEFMRDLTVAITSALDAEVYRVQGDPILYPG